MSLPQTIMWGPAHHWFQHCCRRTPVVVCLHIELHTLSLLICVILKLGHDALSAKYDLTWKQSAGE
jgi:hypothetical protein